MKAIKQWLKIAPTLTILALVTWIAPSEPLDPWSLFSPKKIASMILALATVQALGSALAQYLGARMGALLTGFFGGIISSTATTASLAKRSSVNTRGHETGEILTFLSATGAMLFEGLVIVVTGSSEVHLANLLIFIGPLVATCAMAFSQYRRLSDRSDYTQTREFLILPILKLAVFILLILSLSKIGQRFMGDGGLLAITAVVSLFEIHGSVISNVQLQEFGAISENLLSSLLAVSVLASYLSKLFLIWTLGSAHLRSLTRKCTLLLFASLAISWAISMRL